MVNAWKDTTSLCTDQARRAYAHVRGRRGGLSNHHSHIIGTANQQKISSIEYNHAQDVGNAKCVCIPSLSTPGAYITSGISLAKMNSVTIRPAIGSGRHAMNHGC